MIKGKPFMLFFHFIKKSDVSPPAPAGRAAERGIYIPQAAASGYADNTAGCCSGAFLFGN